MKKLLTRVLAAALLFGYSSIVSAEAIYIGTYDGNDPSHASADLDAFETTVSDWYNTYFETSAVYETEWGADWDISLYAKVDGFGRSSENKLQVFAGEGGDNKKGTWQTAGPINMFSVKAASGYALYWLAPAALSGEWTTGEILNNGGKQPDISHLSAWTVTGYTPPENPVPEPGTLILFGIGLLGISSLGRRCLSS